MDDHTIDLIKNEADRIRVEIGDGSIYGEPIDHTNNDMMLVAAYYCGINKWIPGGIVRYPVIGSEQ